MSREEEREFREELMEQYRKRAENDKSGELKEFRKEWIKKIGGGWVRVNDTV